MKRTQSKAVKPARKGAVKVEAVLRYVPPEADVKNGRHVGTWRPTAANRIIDDTECDVPYYLLPADPDSYDAMVDQIAIPRMPAFPNPRLTQERLERLAEMMRKMVRQDLAAIGIRRNPRAARANKGRKD